MLKRKISLFLNISTSFAFIIVMSFFLSIGIEHFNTTRRLPILLTEVQSANMANILSLLYSRQGNWNNLASTVRDLTSTMPDNKEGHAFRVIVEDSTGKKLYNSFTELFDSRDTVLIEGKSENLTDYVTNLTIGRIVLYVDEKYLETKTTDYLLSALKEQFILTLGAILIALIPAAVLSNRLSRPLTRLSRASGEIRSGNNIQITETYKTAELAALTESFNQMSQTLKKQKELRQRLIGDLSHEINTPLNIIDLDARGIQNGLIDKDEGLESIRAEIDKLSGLIKDLDWLAETDAGEISLEIQTVDLPGIIKKETERWQFNADRLNIALIFQNELDGETIIQGDGIRIRQVISNLLENCLKYAPESEEIVIRLFRTKKQISISVTDQGPGIPAGEIDEIFERLYRLDDSRNRGTGGRGLGLSIARSIMEMHKGRLTVESPAGKGSTFILTFPMIDTGK
ncbi:sensor histidine kinase [Spirochaeta isovalerica]|uniref:histidine kinase n=1 Tax=Spirochaeta isovalerica TaxID=150 RepID=A0A841R5F5_9SPIO|nr:HAMP domain-containing sensor histidine kinase [Spirochaeta isovalerica]MBB6480404.1 signal transduction histidine kinase [Spirochaeta isovalerica]